MKGAIHSQYYSKQCSTSSLIRATCTVSYEVTCTDANFWSSPVFVCEGCFICNRIKQCLFSNTVKELNLDTTSTALMFLV